MMESNYEQLVKALRIHASVDIECYECAYYDDCCINGNGHTKMMTDAAAAIESLQAQLPKRGEIVRCGECKWNLSCGYISTRSYAEWKDWFCADGEMEVQDADT